jgi:two-component system nitrogen regulation sensor histidine kinase NtrY
VAGADVADGAAQVQGVDHPAPRWREGVRWAAVWTALLALALWMRRPFWGWLVVAAVAALLWTALSLSRGRRRGLAVAALLGAGIAAGGWVQLRLDRVARDWERVRFTVEEEAGEALSHDLDALVDRGEAAVDSAIAAARGADPAFLFGRLTRIRERTGVSAVAVYGPGGAPVAWAGEHRGTVPDTVRAGLRTYFFSDGPLFGYLYFTRSFAGESTAVAAVLLEASVEAGEGTRTFAQSFAAEHGITPRFTIPERAQGESIWDWATDRPILSVSFSRLTQALWRERILSRGRWGVAGAWAAVLLLLAASWYHRRRNPGVPVLVATLGVLLAPVGEMLGAEGAFSPLAFVLPLPGDLTLGHLLVFLAGTAVLLLTFPRPDTPAGGWRLAVRVGAAALILPLVLGVVRGSASEGLLAGEAAGGITLLLAATLALALPLYLLFPRPAREGSGGPTAWWWVPALLQAVVLGAVLVLLWEPGLDLPAWTPALWSIPFGLFAAAFSRSRLGRGSLAPWLAAGWLAATAATAHLWAAHQEARIGQAERELSRLGTVADPYLDFLLRQFAERALSQAAEGREGVALLYQSWLAGGLATPGYEARLTLWQDSTPTAELRLTDVPLPDSLILPVLDSARAAETPILKRFTRQPDVHYLLLVPLPGERVISVAVPPRRYIGRSTALARLLDPGRELEDEGATALSLVPVADTAAVSRSGAGTFAALDWLRVESGWRSETLVAFPAGPVHAHLVVRVPSPIILGVRALLVLALGLGAMVLVWGVARTLCGEPFGLAPREWVWVRTFRGRLTLALFAFFLLPLAIFGATAYRALAREVVRTAEALAERSLEQAASEARGQSLTELAEHVRADLLLYENGVLTGAAPPEVVELGLYNTWLPPGVYRGFFASEEEEYVQEQRLGGRDYLLAYRRLGPAQVLAAPTPLASGEIARRHRELGNVVFLAVLLAAGLSVILSLLVGRALSRPIEDLSQAAAAVGAGNLRLRLPERREDEFGGLYRSFNRMVRRLRKARAAVVRETRRTEAVVAEAGTGVLALDATGRVALINARAEEILGIPVEVGGPVPETTPISVAVARAVQLFRHSGEAEHGEEVEVEGRVVRLRLRRLRAEAGVSGAVVALEDITSEIRTARVLAWGEMARQVAHEIKNPLTPIKLSVQHLRRAHADGRADFGEILERNVAAILAEIDRLGEIARAFARFGTPAEATETQDLEPVELGRVVEETLALYRGGGDGIDYRVEVSPAMPRAFTRVGELKEVLVNLLENARAALPEGGEIRISSVAADGWVVLDVADTGEGIPPEALPRIFEPQFSTRTSGTGLGLAIVRRLVESWGAEVGVDSEPGAGTTVHLRMRGE